ncbi:DUF4085 family protein [Sporosarcina sp. G11-34]|uniref:DUF4085 family protein n=1 Tax=Sporosarcina sp. G11-34 TaxID=2849605 RepID=UPI0022A95D76|nr:DUF4085 family protein [Sporosarcina sp. G11-34]MCZ2258117.1 DUF4085 domain-containing protein [Sporosarcina sp. G11-34]
MEEIERKYSEYYNSIENELPRSIIQLFESSLHDAEITSLDVQSEDVISITLDCRSSFYDANEIKLTFLGVKEVLIPEGIVGSYWLYNEVYPKYFNEYNEDFEYVKKRGFELHVLLDCFPLAEFTVMAEGFLIEVLKE